MGTAGCCVWHLGADGRLGMNTKEPGPDSTSGDYDAMAGYWRKAQTMLDGADAMRDAGELYLPKFPLERKKNYEYRRANAKFTNIFRDIVEHLASKPFAKPVVVDPNKVGSQIKALADDIDSAGNNLHVFASRVFFAGIAKAVDYIMVDYTDVPVGATMAQEKAMGARPYWVQIAAENVVAVETAMVNGKEEFVHVRILEPTKVRSRWTETIKERVRVYDRPKTKDVETGLDTYGEPTWELYEKQKLQTGEWVWVKIGSGALRVGKITLVPFVTGRRKGTSWQFEPPMRDAADLQIEHYQQETNLKSAKELTCFPMLKGKGIAPPPQDKSGRAKALEIGPAAVLYAPPTRDGMSGDWDFLEPGAESLKFLADQVDKTEQQLRELGRQPLTAQSGNLTVITTAVAASKGNSAVQAWALALKDALELALQYTALWLKDTTSKAEVTVYTDFGIETSDASSMDQVLTMRAAGDLDRESMWDEAQRRGVLSADFDAEAAKERLAEEAPAEPSAEELAASMLPGKQPPPGNPTPPTNDRTGKTGNTDPPALKAA